MRLVLIAVCFISILTSCNESVNDAYQGTFFFRGSKKVDWNAHDTHNFDRMQRINIQMGTAYMEALKPGSRAYDKVVTITMKGSATELRELIEFLEVQYQGNKVNIQELIQALRAKSNAYKQQQEPVQITQRLKLGSQEKDRMPMIGEKANIPIQPRQDSHVTEVTNITEATPISRTPSLSSITSSQDKDSRKGILEVQPRESTSSTQITNTTASTAISRTPSLSSITSSQDKGRKGIQQFVPSTSRKRKAVVVGLRASKRKRLNSKVKIGSTTKLISHVLLGEDSKNILVSSNKTKAKPNISRKSLPADMKINTQPTGVSPKSIALINRWIRDVIEKGQTPQDLDLSGD